MAQYYVSTSGSDTNSGTSVGSAWRTLGKISSFLNNTSPSSANTFTVIGPFNHSGTFYIYSCRATAKQIITTDETAGEVWIRRGTFDLATETISGYSGGSTEPTAMAQSCVNVEITKFRIEGGGIGIQIAGPSNGSYFSQFCAIRDCKVRGHLRQGVQILGREDTYNNEVSGCDIYSNALRNRNAALRDVSGPYAGGSNNWDNGLLCSWSYADALVDCGSNAGSYANGNKLLNNRVWNNWGEGINTFQSKYTTTQGNWVWDNFSVSIYPEDSGYQQVIGNFCYGSATSPWPTYANARGFDTFMHISHERASRPHPSNLIIQKNIVVNPKAVLWMTAFAAPSLYLSNVLIEHNLFVAGPATWLDSGGTNLIRWNDGVGGSHSGCIYRNNAVRMATGAAAWNSPSGRYPTGFTGSNNLATWLPASAFPGDALGTALFVQSGPDYLSPGLHLPQYWSPAAGSPAIGMGIATPLLTDFFGNPYGA